jgi:biopolymer transport protein ExbD
MRLRQAAGRDEVELNVTSLIDVVLLLLIFFMLTTTFVRPSQLTLKLPEAAAGQTVPAERRELEIGVTERNEFLVDGRPLVDSRPETLEAALRKVREERGTAAEGSRRVALSADGRASHQTVVTAIDVAQRLGFSEVRIATVRARSDE